MLQKVFVLGLGNVGKEFVKRVVEKDSSEFHKNPTQIVGLAEPGRFLFDPEGINEKILEKITVSKDKMKEEMSQGQKYENMEEIIRVVKKDGLDGEIIFVDLTSGRKDLLQFHKNIIEQTSCGLVTANKNPISLYGLEDFQMLTRFHHRYDADVTVMGGSGIVRFINERKEIRDEIKSIRGCFSGTLGYILSELEQGKKLFSEIVKEANEQGYTEPNPWDDLNGLDVARKILILARFAGHKVNIEDISVEPLIEKRFGELKGGDFFKGLKTKDEYFAQLQKEAKKNNKVLRYVGEMIVDKNGELKLTVGLKEMPKDSDFGSLNGTANLVVVDTDTLCSPVPYVLKSRGAGLAVTADAIRVGILRLMPYGVKGNN